MGPKKFGLNDARGSFSFLGNWGRTSVLFSTMLRTICLNNKPKVTNIYHCTVHKTASQWIHKILSDRKIYQYSGLKPYHYQSCLPEKVDMRKLLERSFDTPFPERTIVSPIYIAFDNYNNIPKPKTYRSFFVTRDPRDIVVSNYFSRKYSHSLNPRIEPLRQQLRACSGVKEGLLVMINWLEEDGTFQALRSWNKAERKDEGVMLVSYEALVGHDSDKVFEDLFSHLQIDIPKDVLSELLKDYNFNSLSEGRKTGEEDIHSHYRKGISGDWKNYFDQQVTNEFKRITGDLVYILGYERNVRW
ncbi:MAG: sulfotransferase domain-containing protein [Proteobacteria bacterium]|nr:sulfotransferase domain-containing protein [Pseudomonadota bacterium]